MTEIPDDVRDLFEGANFVHLATIGKDGGPQSVAIWAGLEGDRIVFFSGAASQKGRNIARDPRVAFSVVAHDNPYRTAWVRGQVVHVREPGPDSLRTIDALSQKYTHADFPMRTGVVFEVEVDLARTLTLPFQQPA